MLYRANMKLLLNVFNVLRNQAGYYSKEAANLVKQLEKGMLLNSAGNLVNAADAFTNKNIIGYYFAAGWCNICKQFLPKVKELYKQGKEINAGLEIIYVPSDVDAETMLDYFKDHHGGWYAIPMDDGGSEAMRQNYNVTHIPQIVVVKTDGQIITKEGSKDINLLGPKYALEAWIKGPS